VILTREQAEKTSTAVAAAVGAFSFKMDVDQAAGRNALFGALLAEFVAGNGSAARDELEQLVQKIEAALPRAAELDAGAASVEVSE
jgi:hypothetical protein